MAYPFSAVASQASWATLDTTFARLDPDAPSQRGDAGGEARR